MTERIVRYFYVMTVEATTADRAGSFKPVKATDTGFVDISVDAGPAEIYKNIHAAMSKNLRLIKDIAGTRPALVLYYSYERA